MAISQIYDMSARQVWVGRYDEHGSREVAWDVSPWTSMLGSEGVFALLVTRPRDTDSPYNAQVSFDATTNLVTWAVTDIDTALKGWGRAELHYYVDGALVKSQTFVTIIEKAMFAGSTAPSAAEGWVERMEQAALDAQAAAETAEDAETTATTKASEAATSATTATNKATEASTSASTATSAKDTAVSAASTSTTKATEATAAAATAVSAKDDAVSAKTAAQTAQTGAETAAASVSASAAQITQNTSDISELKEDLASIVENKNIGTVGYFDLSQTQIYVSTSKEQLSIWFPVEAGIAYTFDKTVRTAYSRIGYSTVVPNGGVTITDYQVLNTGTSYLSFTAVKSGYAIIKIYDSRTDGTTNYDRVYSGAVAYKGLHDSTVTRTAKELVNLDGLSFYCGASRNFKTLKAGIEEATKYMDSTLYVDAGTYDLVEEFGSAYFESLTSSSTLSGLVLKNRIRIVFSPNSKVVSHYTGNNQYALSLYSPFNAGEYGFTIENLNLNCSRCRYAIHEERNGASEIYKSEYNNCKMYIDNSNNPAWNVSHCIGGGLGTNAEVVIKNCVFGTVTPDSKSAVYYHIPNNGSNDYRAVVVIDGNYFEQGTVTLEDVSGTPASASDNSEYIITNNSFPQKYAGTDSEGVYSSLSKSYNIRVWNNVIRASA